MGHVVPSQIQLLGVADHPPPPQLRARPTSLRSTATGGSCPFPGLTAGPVTCLFHNILTQSYDIGLFMKFLL